MKNEPNKITATLKVVVTGEFYDDEASEETLRYCVEQDLGDAGFDVDVELLKEQDAKTGHWILGCSMRQQWVKCDICGTTQTHCWPYCPNCGAAMLREELKLFD